MKRRSLLLLLFIFIVAALAGAFAWYLWGERHTPAGQPPLATLSAASLETFRSEFNSHADKVRIVVLLSPT
jgi:hypothetical protein